MTRTPLFKNYCSSCIFLGSYKNRDLYYCEGENTIVDIYGNEDHMYNSGLCFIYSDRIYPVEAAERAIIQGLLHPNSPTGGSGQGTVGQEIAKRRARQGELDKLNSSI
jgi:hypothetical protein